MCSETLCFCVVTTLTARHTTQGNMDLTSAGRQQQTAAVHPGTACSSNESLNVVWHVARSQGMCPVTSGASVFKTAL